MPITLDGLRRLAVTQSLFAPTTLKRALQKFGFVQADPIRAPARAQDLMLRHRVNGYRSGDLERQYAKLDIQEDFFINYGFVSSSLQALMHPRPSTCIAGFGESVHNFCWSSFGHAARFIHGRWINISRMARSKIIGVAPPMSQLTCSMPCIIRGSCAWPARRRYSNLYCAPTRTRAKR